MSYKLVKNLTTINYTKGNKGRKYIVIHYTGNKTDTAAANANYFKSVNRGASAHYFVDRTQVVQVVSDNDTAWSVGVNYGSNNLFNQCKNNNSINIEMCSTNGKIADETYNNTVALTKSLMKKYGIPASRVVRHWDVCSKACPGWTGWGAAGKDASIWNKFKKDIGDTSTSSNTSSSSSSNSTNSSNAVNYRVKINTKSGVNVRKGAGTRYGIIKAIANGTTCTITKESNGWGYAKEYGGWISLQYTKKVTTSTGTTSSSSAKITLKIDGYWGTSTTKRLQQIFKTTVDGKVSNQFSAYKSQNPGLDSGWEWEKNPTGNSPLIKAIQKKVGATQDGHIGPDTIKKIQKWMGCTQDGVFSAKSPCIKKLQQWCNNQK